MNIKRKVIPMEIEGKEYEMKDGDIISIVTRG